MSSSSSKAARSRRSSILKVRQTVVESTVDVAKQSKNLRRVSFHHEKTVKEFDKDRHELSATSPLKEKLKESMSDFDSTKSNSTLMSVATPDRTAAGSNTMMVMRGAIAGGEPASFHHIANEMSISILEGPTTKDKEETHVKFRSEMLEMWRDDADNNCREIAGDNTMDVFGKPVHNHSYTNQLAGKPLMDMDISQADNTYRADLDDTANIFGGGCTSSHASNLHTANKFKEDANDTMNIFDGERISSYREQGNPHLNETMNVFGGTNLRKEDISHYNETVLMDVTGRDSSSQEDTMAVFGRRDQINIFDGGKSSSDGKEVPQLNEILYVNGGGTNERKDDLSHYDETVLMDVTGRDGGSQEDTMAVFGMRDQMDIVRCEKSLSDEKQERPDLDDSMNVSGGVVNARKDDQSHFDETTLMEVNGKECSASEDDTMTFSGKMNENTKRDDVTAMELTQQPSVSPSLESLPNSSPMISSQSPAMNIFKRRGDERMEESNDESSKRWKVDSEKMEAKKEVINRVDDEMEIVDATLAVFAIAGGEDPILFESANPTFDVPMMDITTNRMAMTDSELPNFARNANHLSQIELKKKVDASENVTMDLFGEKKENTMKKRMEEVEEVSTVEMDSVEEEERDEEEEKRREVEENRPSTNKNKTQLSTLIEVSSQYTTLSSQCASGHGVIFEDKGEEEKILDVMEKIEEKDRRMDGIEEKEIEKDEEKVEEEEKSVNASTMSALPPSPSPSPSSFPFVSNCNTAFSTSFSKRSMMDETRLSDRSMLYVQKTFVDVQLERVSWMNEEVEDEEVRALLSQHAQAFQRQIQSTIQRSESTVADQLSRIREEKGELMAKSIDKLNPAKLKDMRVLFDVTRRRVQSEWWEARAERAEQLRKEVQERMQRDREEMVEAEQDVLTMISLNKLKKEMEELERETMVGRGMEKDEMEKIIESIKEKEKVKRKLEKKVAATKLLALTQSTQAFRVIAERCDAVGRSIKEKLAAQESTKRNLRDYLTRLDRNST